MTDYEKLLEEVRLLGMDKKWAKMFVKKFRDDEQYFPVSDEQRAWAMKRGFFPGRIDLYGLNEENYRSFMPDWHYFMLHPLNHHFKIWVNDKLTLKYALNSCGVEDSMPEYYLYVENDGKYTYLMDAPESVEKNEDFIFNLLKLKKRLAIKPNSGTSGGAGFVKLELRGDKLFANNREITRSDYDRIVSDIKNYVVTQYACQHHSLARIWGDSECTLRVIMYKKKKQSAYDKDSWECSLCFARFGSSLSGGASNLSSGGIGIGFDWESGKFNDYARRYKKFCPDGNTVLTCHPDSKVVWKGEHLPNWDLVKQKILDICAHISSLSYLGFDVIITENGMKLCEINTHPACDYAQVMCGPVMKKRDAEEFFKSKGFDKFSGEDFYKAYLNSQE